MTDYVSKQSFYEKYLTCLTDTYSPPFKYNPIVQTLVIRWKLWDLSGISATWQALFCLI